MDDHQLKTIFGGSGSGGGSMCSADCDMESVPIEASTTYFNGIECVPATAHLSVSAFRAVESSDDTREDRMLRAYFVSRNYMQGVARINDSEIVINAKSYESNLIPGIIGFKPYLIVYDRHDSTFVKQGGVGDTLHVANRKIHIMKSEKGSIFVEDLGESIDSSRVGRYLPILTARSLDGSTTVCVNDSIKGKYTFIDFWGTWCGPCMASLPKLIELREKTRQRDDVAIVGIAIENEHGVEKLQTLVKEQSISWLNVWTDLENKQIGSTPQGKMGVSVYPTYVIVDNTGKIVFSSTDQECREQDPIEFFLKLIGM